MARSDVLGPTFVLVFWAAASLVIRVTWIDSEFQKRSEVRLPAAALISPGQNLLHAVTLEHRLAIADLAWLDAVQTVGQWALSSRAAWDRIEAASVIATDLDPRFYTVYEAAATVLSVWGKRVDASDGLLKKGHRALPSRWRLPFLVGYNAFFLRGDANRAADWFETAAGIPGRPNYLPSLAGRIRFFGGEPEKAIAFLERMIESLSGPARRDAEWRLGALKSEPRLRLFDQACRSFYRERGVLPQSGSDLVGEGFLMEPPFDLFGKPIELTAECVAFTEMVEANGRTTPERARALRTQKGSAVGVREPDEVRPERRQLQPADQQP